MDLMVYFVDFQHIRTPWLTTADSQLISWWTVDLLSPLPKRLTLDQLQTATVAKILLGIAAPRFAMIKTQGWGIIDTIRKILQNISEAEAGNDTDIIMIISRDGNANPLPLCLWSFDPLILDPRCRSEGSDHWLLVLITGIVKWSSQRKT